MANALSWPSSLPTPLISSGSGEIELGLISSPMDDGFLRTRQRFAHQPGTFTMTIMCTSEIQSARLKSFVKEAVGATFDLDAMVPGNTSQSITTQSAQITGNLQYRGRQGGTFYWTLPIRVEESPDPDVDGYDYDFFDATDGYPDEYVQAFENSVESFGSII